MTRYIMRRKRDGQFFVKCQPNTGLGDLTTDDPNEAALYNHAVPQGFRVDHKLWEVIEVEVEVTICGCGVATSHHSIRKPS